MSADDRSVLQVRDLSVTYRHDGAQRRVVADVSYQIKRGQILALVGETGSGKTTAALAPFGLLDPTAVVTGAALLDAGDGARQLVGLPPHERRQINGRRVGVVFQDSLAALNPLRTIGAHVDEAVRNAGRAADTAPPARSPRNCSGWSACPTHRDRPWVPASTVGRDAPTRADRHRPRG